MSQVDPATPADPQALAEACAAAMWTDDRASQGMGMTVEAVRPGYARLAMTVDARMVNGHGSCHGGFIFSLADSAFAFACNSRDTRAVAAQCSIAYISPGRLGDRLVATAEERTRYGRSGIYDVRVMTEAGTVIAEFRGHSREIGGSFLAAAAP